MVKTCRSDANPYRLKSLGDFTGKQRRSDVDVIDLASEQGISHGTAYKPGLPSLALQGVKETPDFRRRHPELVLGIEPGFHACNLSLKLTNIAAVAPQM